MHDTYKVKGENEYDVYIEAPSSPVCKNATELYAMNRISGEEYEGSYDAAKKVHRNIENVNMSHKL